MPLPKRQVIFIIGSACSGKSTLSGYLGRKGYGTVLRTGDILKEHISANFDKPLSDFVGSDHLIHIPKVDDAKLIMDTVVEEAAQKDRLVVDGFPRSLHQTYTFIEDMRKIRTHVLRMVVLSVPIKELLRRMISRGRVGDTEDRIMQEVNMTNRIVALIDRNNIPEFSVLKVNVPANYEEVQSAVGDSAKVKTIPFMDALARRLEGMFDHADYLLKHDKNFSGHINDHNLPISSSS